jgi:hypothetical protein
MDWQSRVAGVLDAVGALEVPTWLAPTSTFVSVLLLLALLTVVIHNLRLRRELAGRSGDAAAASPLAPQQDRLQTVSLEGEGEALIDRWLPRRPASFVLAVVLLAAGCWVLGLALATDGRKFVSSHEWQAQPLYLAVHLVTVRLFATAFVRSFLAGILHLDIAEAVARHRMWLVLGPIGTVIAAATAVPFCIYDYRYLTEAGGEGVGPAADGLLFAMWCAEWLLMAFVWVMVVGYMLLTHWAVSKHRFRSMIEMVLHDRQYRPFLQMSVQGATIVLGFWIVNILYVWYSGGELSDYTGAAVTLVLVVVGFLPPLLELRGKVSRAVSDEMANLRRRLDRLIARGAPVAAGAAPPATARELEDRLDEVLVMLRISYLEKLHAQLGQSEATDIVIKLLVPLTTVAWYGYKYYKGMP